MKDFIEIGGTEYRVEVNWNTISDFLEIRQYKLADLAKMAEYGAADINALLWCAITEGERLEGRKFDLSMKDMCAALSPEDINKFLEIFQSHYVGNNGDDAKGSKKKESQSRWSSRK